MIIRQSLAFMSRAELAKYGLFLMFRCLVSLLDLVGVLAVGYLGTSAALFLSKGSDPNRVFKVLNFEIPTANIHTVPMAVLVTLLVFIVKAIASIALTRTMAIELAKIEARATRKITETVMGNSLAEARSLTREELLFATSIGASSAFTGMLNNLATLVSEGFLFLGLVGTFLLVDPLSTMSVLVYFGLVALGIQYFTGQKLQSQSKLILENSIQTNSYLNDLNSAFRELAVLGKREKYFAKIEESRLASAKAIGAQLYLSGMPRYVIETAVLVGVMAFGGYKLMVGDLANSVTTIAVFFTGSMRLVAAMLPWQAALVSIKGNFPQASSAHALLGRNPSQIASESSRRKQGALGISFTGVTYTYSGSESAALHDISFEIPAGSQAAFIGVSGSGKSTIADIMMGLAKPDRGVVLIGGEDPIDIIQKEPGCLSYVPQSPGALSGNLEQNIAVMENHSNQKSLERSIEIAGLAELVRTLPDGLQTELGNNNDSLSGGQLQRLGLARALFPDPSVLLMDEATSSLDAHSERDISLALDKLRGHTTVVLIAHRLNTVQHADIVFLVDEGRIVDQGTFKDIMDRNPSVSNAVDLMSIKQ